MFTIKIANRFFTIKNKYNYVKELCENYIVPTPQNGSFYISAAPQDVECDDEKLLNNLSDSYLESLAIYQKICTELIKHNILLFHCSSLKIDEKAYLFTAPSGTGKSTHAWLWRKHFGSRITMINDDKPLIAFTKDEIRVYGTPYCGKHGIETNTSAPVAGIIVLRQASQNTIERLSPQNAFPKLMSQAYRVYEPNEIVKIIDMVHRLSRLPVFSMGCTISDEAVVMAYNALKGAEYEA